MANRVLIVGTDNSLLCNKSEILRHSYETECAAPEEALERLRQAHYDLVLVCCSTPFDLASSIIRQAHVESPDLPIVRLMSKDSPVLQKAFANAILVEEQDSRPWMEAVHYLLHTKTETSNFY